MKVLQTFALPLGDRAIRWKITRGFYNCSGSSAGPQLNTMIPPGTQKGSPRQKSEKKAEPRQGYAIEKIGRPSASQGICRLYLATWRRAVRYPDDSTGLQFAPLRGVCAGAAIPLE